MIFVVEHIQVESIIFRSLSNVDNNLKLYYLIYLLNGNTNQGGSTTVRL